MKVVFSEDIRNLERNLEEKYGFPTILLMENAASFLFSFLIEKFEDIKKMNIAILCGPGNNGGDGVALARYLYLNGVKKITIFSYLWNKSISDLLEIQLKFIKEEIDIKDLVDEYKALKNYDLIIDGIFGIGLKREIEEDLRKIFIFINSLNKTVISIDVPSGIESDTGKIMGNAIRASYTLTMFLPKLGLFNTPAIDYVGEIVVGKLGIPDYIIDSFIDSKIYLVEKDFVSNLIRRPSRTLHKGSKGRVLIIGGSIKYTGAPILSALSALRSGCGMVYLAIPEEIHTFYRASYPEIIYIPLKSKHGFISSENLDKICEVMRDFNINAVALGPGIGLNEEAKSFVIEFLKRVNIPTVVDADALSYIGEILDTLTGRDLILTPHYGEMGRILNKSPKEISEDRFNLGKFFVNKYKIHLILKGPFSLFFTPENEVYINPFADSLLATAGSGDVLTGILGGLLAQGYSIKEACIIGNYVHGYAPIIWKRKKGEFGLIASEIIYLIPEIMGELTKEKSI